MGRSSESGVVAKQRGDPADERFMMLMMHLVIRRGVGGGLVVTTVKVVDRRGRAARA